MADRTSLACAIAGVAAPAGGGHAPRLILGPVRFAAGEGEFVGIIGPSGCGKSTLARALAGQLEPVGGDVLLAGHPVGKLRAELPLAIGYLAQFGAFHPDLTVGEMLRDAAALRLPPSVSRGVRDGWLARVIGLARLGPVLDQRYRTLSGGQMRRVALAEELIGDPPFLFLDELTSGLDAHADRELMRWLRDLAHGHGKTVVLVTHATYHLELCDRILFLQGGQQLFFGPFPELLRSHGVGSVADLFAAYDAGSSATPLPVPDPAGLARPVAPVAAPPPAPPPPGPLKTARPPGGWRQLPTLLARQARLALRDRGQLALQAALVLTFPVLVAVFAYQGLPQVRQLTLQLQSNLVTTLAEQLLYVNESFHVAALVSGLAMFQVILLTLMGANNGAREIAKERAVLEKERRVGLSPAAYVGTKFGQIALLSAGQAFWMAWFVKTACGFPGALGDQFLVLFATVLAMGATCLAISAAAASAERASLLAIYLVGFQLPLSGAALALPEWLNTICRPFIVAYWGWSGFLRTLHDTGHYDIVKQSTKTAIAPYGLSLAVLALHVAVALGVACWFVGRAGGRPAR